jgi:hypothetical protein
LLAAISRETIQLETLLRREVAMITAVVRFRLPEGTTRDDAKVAASRVSSGSTISVETIEPEEGFIFRIAVRLLSGSIPDTWKSTIAQRYGAQPEISFYETAVIVENADQKASAA